MKKLFIIVFAGLLLMGGCRARRPEATRFYMLEYRAAETENSRDFTSLPFSVELAEIDVHPAYATSQIALREENHELQYFVNHLWASRPQQSLGRFVLDYINHTRIFEHADNRFWNVHPDFRLYVTVYNLEVVRERNDFYARLNVGFTLETNDGEVIDRYRNDQSRLLQKRNLNLFTTAINNMFQEELSQFMGKIHFMLTPAR
jgi:ABC-type uncharacterized transport system auxiliary subunit